MLKIDTTSALQVRVTPVLISRELRTISRLTIFEIPSLKIDTGILKPIFQNTTTRKVYVLKSLSKNNVGTQLCTRAKNAESFS